MFFDFVVEKIVELYKNIIIFIKFISKKIRKFLTVITDYYIKIKASISIIYSNNTHIYDSIISTPTLTNTLYNIAYYCIENNKDNQKLVFIGDFFEKISFLPTSTVKYISDITAENSLILFLRKNKVFNKSRYSRNRQTYRTGFY